MKCEKSSENVRCDSTWKLPVKQQIALIIEVISLGIDHLAAFHFELQACSSEKRLTLGSGSFCIWIVLGSRLSGFGHPPGSETLRKEPLSKRPANVTRYYCTLAKADGREPPSPSLRRSRQGVYALTFLQAIVFHERII